MKNIELERLNQVLGLVSKIFMGSLRSARITKIRHYWSMNDYYVYYSMDGTLFSHEVVGIYRQEP